jgi:hypothetical protein
MIKLPSAADRQIAGATLGAASGLAELNSFANLEPIQPDLP